jgi:peptidoglycan hydrolase CwlO-like protein
MAGFDFMEILIMVLVGLLFFKEQLFVLVRKKFGLSGQDTNNDLSTKMDTLAQHFNHETTDILSDIRDIQKDIRDAQKKTCEKITKLIDHIDEMRVNGVRVKD